MTLTSICCNSPLFHTHKLQTQNFSLGLFIMIFTLRLNVRQRASCQSYDRDVHDLCGCENLKNTKVFTSRVNSLKQAIFLSSMSAYNENETCLKLIFTFFQSSVFGFLSLYMNLSMLLNIEKQFDFFFHSYASWCRLTKLIAVKPIQT